MVVTIVDQTVPANLPVISYDLQTDGLNTLREVVFLILVFIDPPGLPTNFYFYFGVKNSFGARMGGVWSSAPQPAYHKGVNRKCIFG